MQIASWATEVKFTSSWATQLAIIGTFLPGLSGNPCRIMTQLAISTHYSFINPIQT